MKSIKREAQTESSMKVPCLVQSMDGNTVILISCITPAFFSGTIVNSTNEEEVGMMVRNLRRELYVPYHGMIILESA